MTHLHVTGCRRSGTTLLFEMLTAGFKHDAQCEHEASIFNAPPRATGELYFSKKPSDITHIEEIFRADPELYLLYIRRDPRAVVTSIHPTRGDIYYASFERWQRYEAAASRLIEHPRFMSIRYEDLVHAPDKVQQQIQEQFTFLRKQGDFSNFHHLSNASEKAQISLKGLRPVSTDGLTHWQQHLPRLRFQLDRYPLMIEAVNNYASDDSRRAHASSGAHERNQGDWITRVQEVRPKSQIYGEKSPGLFKALERDLRYRLKTRRYLKQLKLRDTMQASAQ